MECGGGVDDPGHHAMAWLSSVFAGKMLFSICCAEVIFSSRVWVRIYR